MARRFSSRRRPAAAPHPQAVPSRAKRDHRYHETPVLPGRSLFGCLFISQFPVWAARQANPLLLAAPLLIHQKGRIIAACPQALERGVKIGWLTGRAHSLCPDARVKAFNAAETALMWDEVLAALYKITPRIESHRPGLAFFEPPSRLDELATLSRLVHEWDAQVAIAVDRPGAELSAHTADPGRLRRIRTEKQSAFWGQVPVDLLAQLQVSEETIERLKWFGFGAIGDLNRLSKEQILCQFGSEKCPEETGVLWRYARVATERADRQPVQTYSLPAMRRSRLVFEQAATNPHEWEQALHDIVLQAVTQLNGLGAGAVMVMWDTPAGSRQASKLLRETVSAPRPLFNAARELLLEHIENSESIQALEVRLMRLGAAGMQATLFDPTRYEKTIGLKCPVRLVKAIRTLEERFTRTMWRWRMHDEYSTCPEERYSLVPVLGDLPEAP